jgi:hypothetical protein
MPQPTFFQNLKDVFGIVTGIGVILLSYIAIVIRKGQLESDLAREKSASSLRAELIAHQQEVKDDLSEKHEELVTKQNEILTDFNKKHAENKQDLAVHIAEDRGSFATITSTQQINATTLARIEGKLNGFGGHS